MGNLAEKISAEPRDVAATVEAVFGCKWSLRILELIRQGVCRPGAIERALEGLTPRVQTYYFRRMVGLGILDRVVYPEIPPRVEYHLTEFGRHFLPILDSIAELQRNLNRSVTDLSKPPADRPSQRVEPGSSTRPQKPAATKS